MAAGIPQPPSINLAADDLALNQANTLLTYHRALNMALAHVGLSSLAWPALILLFKRPQASLDEIAKAMGMPMTTALRWMKALEEKGFVVCPLNAGHEHSISETGRRAVQRVLKNVA